ncbi:MAG: hypothetical protein GXO07_00025 [Crenarchaeota archaeon]|nr:hypothetical protein [Thermoproteota archaeon]
MLTPILSYSMIKTSFYVLLLLTMLIFVQYAVVNWNTRQPWYPFVVGPLMGVSFIISLAIVAFGGDYQLGAILTILFISLTLITYALTYNESTILDYEYAVVLMGLILAIFILMDFVEGSVDLKGIHLTLVLLIIYLPYLIYVLLAFKYGSYYNYITMILALMLALSNFLLLVPVFTERLIQAIMVDLLVIVMFWIYVLSAGTLGPDVTEWFIRATLLSSYLALLWTAYRSGWE